MKDKLISILDKFTVYSLYVMIFFIPISKAGIESFFGFVFLGFLIKKILKPDFRFLKSGEHFFLLLFLFFSALSLLNSGPYLIKGFKALFLKWGEYILIFWLIQDTLSNRKRIRTALGIFLSVAVIVGIDGIIQRLLRVDFLRNKGLIKVNQSLYAITSAFNYYNDFAVYLVVILSLIIALLILKQVKGLNKWMLLAEGFLLWLCLLLTFSRGGWLGFISSLLLMLFLSGKAKKVTFLISIFIFVIFLVPEFRGRGIFIFQPEGDAHRFTVWQVALRMIKENPLLGKGIGTFMDYLHKYSPGLTVQYAHNCYLQIWAETGIFSLLSFLGFLSALLFKGISSFKKNQDAFILGVLCGIFGFLVHSFFDTHLYSLQLSVLFWSMAGILCSLIKFQN